VEHLEDKAYGSIMVVPILSGSGMRMKILEGAALSMPIITTTVGVEGLDFAHGESCLIADTPQEFAEAIHRLCQDASLREKLARNAQAVYTQQYSATQLSKTREQVYFHILHP
jgi:glycosyltransferase involved in cell wall biosynthesis